MTLKVFYCLFVGYIFGNFSTGYFVGKRENIDIRKYGSGNAGATNALRTLGKKAAIITFIGDFMKAMIPMLIIRLICFKGCEDAELMALVTGFGVVLGHNFPFWLHFKGGKGISATAGVFVTFDYRIVAIGLPVFVIIVLLTKYVSLGSLVLSLMLPVWIIVTRQGAPYYAAMLGVGFCFTISAVFKHRANIKRLINGTENKIGQHVNIEKKC